MGNTANDAYTVLSAVFAYAELWDVTTRRSPAPRAARFEERAVERFLPPAERKRLEAELAKAASLKPCQPGYIQPDAMWAIRRTCTPSPVMTSGEKRRRLPPEANVREGRRRRCGRSVEAAVWYG